MSSDDKGSAAAPKRVESDVYDRQIRLWGADAQVGVVLWLVFHAVPLPFVPIYNEPHFSWPPQLEENEDLYGPVGCCYATYPD